MSKPILGYYNVRGYAQPIRNLLAYAGVDFIDKRYPMDPVQLASPEWQAEKHTFGFDFPNTPYLIDGDVKLTQSLAILRYLARKYGLEGATETEKNRIALLEQQINDLQTSFFLSLLKGDEAAFLQTLPDQLAGVSAFLGVNQFAAGSSVAYVDFLLYEYLVRVLVYKPEIIGRFENLVQYIKRIEALPRLAEWIKKLGPTKFSAVSVFPFSL
uniref:glutathione transferase n=1 Tax=Acarus siro TaxID=66546 RepID=B0KZJ3_ACASI|nr:allergen Aca s 8 [Acarus siro]